MLNSRERSTAILSRHGIRQAVAVPIHSQARTSARRSAESMADNTAEI